MRRELLKEDHKEKEIKRSKDHYEANKEVQAQKGLRNQGGFIDD